MFGWAMTFLIVALGAALSGFGGVATFTVDIARVIFSRRSGYSCSRYSAG
jgi:uncharacterized membrane protein YtjA (UPF0391 family)